MILLSKDILLELDEIRAARVGRQGGPLCGVYFLFSGDDLIYVGQSVNILSRLLEHTGKGFDSFTYILCERDELDDLEAAYILRYMPRLNGEFCNSGRKCVPTTRGMDFLVRSFKGNVLPFMTRGQRTANRRNRADYNAYMREYMRKRRAG